MKTTRLFTTLLAFALSLLISSAQTFVKDENHIINQTATDVNYSGAAWVDFDNDGDLDLHATRNHFFINNGDGSFTYDNTVAITQGISGQANGTTWADYNNDGVLDFALSGTPIGLFKGNGASFDRITEGNFNPANDFRGWAPAWGDYNNDGYVDLFVTHAIGFHGGGDSPSFLFVNNGDGRFTRNIDYHFAQETAPYTIPSWTDYDMDGDLDLFIGSGPAGTAARDYIYINQLAETGTADLIRLEDGLLGTDLQDGQVYNAVDFDNDGDFDIYLTNYAGALDRFYLNNDGTYESISNPLTGNRSSLGNNWGDTDNDGDLDAIVTSDGTGSFFYRNNGDGTFTAITDNGIRQTGNSRGASFGDPDNDGDLDVFIAGGGNARGYFENELSNNNNWVKFDLEGTVSNRAAIGAKVKLRATISGNEVWQIRELLAQNSFGAHNSLIVHFGLGDANVVDEVIVEWPSGETTEMLNVAVNDTYNITEEIPSGFLRANFTADSLSDYSEVTVQFTDLSFVDPADPITSWEWDFDNDGSVDATTQNAEWIFNEVGLYSVSLTVTNSTGSQTRTREDYVEVLVTPGIPEIMNSTPIASDTTIGKSGSVAFSVDAIDPTGYDLTYNWTKNGSGASVGSTYNYQSSFILPTPRTDTVVVVVSNPGNSVSRTWLVHVVNDISGIEDDAIPTSYALEQNYPNPFNPSTKISYSVPEQTFVTLKVYDVLGNEVSTLVNSNTAIGNYSVELNAEQFASGIYFYSLRAGNFSETKKMILIK